MIHPKTTTKRLRELEQVIAEVYPRHIGFPAAKDFDYSELYPFFGYMLQNIGDPYETALNYNHSKEMEREVIEFFADLFRAPKRDRWGYVTNGGTEGNMYGVYIARELYPDARLYFSESVHYSLPKIANILRLPLTIIRAQQSGEMNYDDLRRQLKLHKKQPAIVVAGVGTTMTEARDNVATIKKILQESGVPNHYIHADAALAGIYTALLKPHHPFDFKDGADSISISGHKFIGAPMACGVVIVRSSLRNHVIKNYTGSTDTTLSGSRNGHTPLMLWYAIQKWGIDGFRKRAEDSLALAEYTHQKLLDMGWPTWRNPNTITVMLAEPPKEIFEERGWQLAIHDGWSHLVCIPGVARRDIDAFLHDLAQATTQQPAKTKQSATK